MLLHRFTLFTPTPARALRAAIAAHHPQRLRELLDQHGERVFARALSGLSGRRMADALSMLPLAQQLRVRRHLTPSAQARLDAIHHQHFTRLGAAS